MPESRIEINIIALAKDGKTKKQVSRAGPAAVHGRHHGGPCRRSAVHLRTDGGARRRAGGAGEGRSGAAVLRDPGQGGTARNPRRRPRRSVEAAGTSLKNAVRIQQFHCQPDGPAGDARSLVGGARRNAAAAVRRSRCRGCRCPMRGCRSICGFTFRNRRAGRMSFLVRVLLASATKTAMARAKETMMNLKQIAGGWRRVCGTCGLGITGT